jgi:hypothetical protein
MNTWFLAPYLLMAGILCFGLLQAGHAGPPPAAPKPKFAPRAIPGMGGTSHADHEEPVASGTVLSSKPKVPVPTVQSPSQRAKAPSGDQAARILYIYRRGTIEVPSAPVPVSLPAPKSAEQLNPATSIVPRPGQVRIISKADAELLLAQPELKK